MNITYNFRSGSLNLFCLTLDREATIKTLLAVQPVQPTSVTQQSLKRTADECEWCQVAPGRGRWNPNEFQGSPQTIE